MLPGLSGEGNSMVSVARCLHADGFSLIAEIPFAVGETIHRFSGQDIRATPTYQSIQIGANRHAFDLDIMAHMNHSCDPSTIIDAENLSVVAARPIAAGDELTFFYPSTEWDMDKPFVCRCNAPKCLGYVAGAKYLAPEVLKRYFINPHILRMYSEIRC
jgi:hypothetical protein